MRRRGHRPASPMARRPLRVFQGDGTYSATALSSEAGAGVAVLPRPLRSLSRMSCTFTKCRTQDAFGPLPPRKSPSSGWCTTTTCVLHARLQNTNCFSRKICSRSASLYCVAPCRSSTIESALEAGFPFRSGSSYWAKRREISLNKKLLPLGGGDRLHAQRAPFEMGFDAGKIEIHAPVPQTAAPTDIRLPLATAIESSTPDRSSVAKVSMFCWNRLPG